MSWKPVLLIILQMLPALSRCWAAGQAAEQQGSQALHTQIKTWLLTSPATWAGWYTAFLKYNAIHLYNAFFPM